MSTITMSIGNNMGRKTIIVPDDKTPKQLLDENNVSYKTAQVMLDGVAMDTKSMNSTLADLGLKPEETYNLVAVQKTSNAR